MRKFLDPIKWASVTLQVCTSGHTIDPTPGVDLVYHSHRTRRDEHDDWNCGNESSNTDEGTTPKYSLYSSTKQNQHVRLFPFRTGRHLHDAIPYQDHSLYAIDDDIIFLGIADGHNDAKHAYHILVHDWLEVTNRFLHVRTLTLSTKSGCLFK